MNRQITISPTTEQPTFWMCHRSGSKGPKKRHETLAAAAIEADRLATANPGTRIYILEAIGAVQSDKVEGEA
jgi:hypothetical protein